MAFVDDGGRYPRAAGADPVLEYWKAIAVMAATLRAVGSDWPITVATNRGPTDTVLCETLDRLGVELREVAFDHAPPPDYFNRFSGSFYLLDAMADAVARVDDDTVLIFVDPDCVWVRDPGPVLESVAASPDLPLAYEITYAPGQWVIGQTLEKLGELYAAIGTVPVPERPPYAGGEFLAGTRSGFARLLPHIETVWTESMRRFEAGESIRANSEEHVLGYALAQLGWSGGTANHLVRRVWTKLPPNRNIRGDEYDLVVWHALIEKGRGLSELYDDVVAAHPALRAGGRRFRRHLALRLRVRLTPRARVKWVAAKVLHGRRRKYPVEW